MPTIVANEFSFCEQRHHLRGSRRVFIDQSHDRAAQIRYASMYAEGLPQIGRYQEAQRASGYDKDLP